MVKLKNQWVRDGYISTLIWRDENYAIAELIDQESKKFVCLEVFKILIRQKGHPDTKSVYPREAVPNTDHWGNTGFSVYTMEQAMKKIEIMRNRKYKHK